MRRFDIVQHARKVLSKSPVVTRLHAVVEHSCATYAKKKSKIIPISVKQPIALTRRIAINARCIRTPTRTMNVRCKQQGWQQQRK